MDDNGRWRAIRVRANRVELRSTAVDPNGSNGLSNLLSESNVRSVPFDDSSEDGLRPAIRSVPIDESKLLSIPDAVVPTGLNVRILVDSPVPGVPSYSERPAHFAFFSRVDPTLGIFRVSWQV